MVSYQRVTIIVILVCALYLVSWAQNPKCRGRRYSCKTSGFTIAEGVCMNNSVDAKGKIFLLQTCNDDNETCAVNATSSKIVKCGEKIKEVTFKLPGETCERNSDCLGSICVESVCKGNSTGHNCTEHSQCEVGYHCNATLQCAIQKEYSEKCRDDYDCVNNCGCNNGTCNYYYSLSSGLPSDNPTICKSGRIVDDKCALPRISVIKGRPCEADEDCALVDANGNPQGYSECQCGYNGGGFTYCSLAEGDSEFQDMLDKFQFILFRSAGCHSLLRFGPCKNIYTDEYVDYMKARRYFEMYPQITYNDQCIRKIYTWEYWQYYFWTGGLYLHLEMITTFVCFLSLTLLQLIT
eukprot:TRINITY_DN11156_c0_g2_i2.p1 TRINITY_DN11156_c0_g2~~TRINITY_DN11156_c0_g2_i2.p1  ORF type:complete len:351 (-),score=24.41 TRINITY_DN11156_c0_g2_i2:120-1172(-)